MSHTLSEVAEKTGRTQAMLRKHIQRGKLRAQKDGTRVIIEDADLDAYLGSDILEEAAAAAAAGNAREIGNSIARLPPRILASILDGIPTQKKAGSPEPFRNATNDVPKTAFADNIDGDHNWSFPVGHQHVDAPRWKHVKTDVWAIGEKEYSWNGWWWAGSDGVEIGEAFSPAHPDAHFRPLAPGSKVK